MEAEVFRDLAQPIPLLSVMHVQAPRPPPPRRASGASKLAWLKESAETTETRPKRPERFDSALRNGNLELCADCANQARTDLSMARDRRGTSAIRAALRVLSAFRGLAGTVSG